MFATKQEADDGACLVGWAEHWEGLAGCLRGCRFWAAFPWASMLVCVLSEVCCRSTAPHFPLDPWTPQVLPILLQSTTCLPVPPTHPYFNPIVPPCTTEVYTILDLYRRVYEELLAVPVCKVRGREGGW